MKPYGYKSVIELPAQDLNHANLILRPNELQSGCPDKENDHQLLLACPFYKSDRDKYQDCLRLQLKRIKDVKQHISRRDMQVPYCPSCGLDFDTQEERIRHSRLQQCQIRDFPRPDGITCPQRDKISSTRARRNQGLSSQWFAVWDLLFPDKPQPASAYVEHPVREAMESLRELWSREGLDIISATFQRYCEQSQSHVYNEHLPTAVSDTMTALFDQFLKMNPSATSQTQVGTTIRGQEVTVSGWDRIQGSRLVDHEIQAESFTWHFLSTSPGLMDFGTLSNSDNTSVSKDLGLDEPMVESGAWGDFLAEGCNSWTDFSMPAEHRRVRSA
ncbi:hypothetical protein CKAH01_00976 [Colletotrichum kahawae]|uniref:C2H2-type domain-containing protein n=1 Tax=Colletotrichum kahawae TaxID=34407 RepID=A0AAD9YLH3_COLKA|nr:hypothetical protein CKAH01_00976 [Colletotrichum kahawae]